MNDSTMAIDLLRARVALCEGGDLSIDYAMRHGIDLQVTEPGAGMLILARVTLLASRHFELGGRMPAAIIEARDESGQETIDLVAWPLHRPEKFATFFGRAAALGARAIFDPATYTLDTPLRVHRTPLEWLQAGCDGCVILDPFRGGRLLLDAPGRIAAQDEAHAAEIAAAIERSLDLSRIVVPARRAAA